MDRKLIALIVVVLVVLGGGALLLTNKGTTKIKNTSSAKTSLPTDKAGTLQVADACKLLTASDAKSLIDGNVVQSADKAGISSADLKLSSCSYSKQVSAGAAEASSNNSRSLNILLRSPKTQVGITGNKYSFTTGKPKDVTDVSGYGEVAYWSQQYGQLNVLKHNNWIILSSGSGASSNYTLDDAKKLADIVIPRL